MESQLKALHQELIASKQRGELVNTGRSDLDYLVSAQLV
jgi:hypothetical protein